MTDPTPTPVIMDPSQAGEAEPAGSVQVSIVHMDGHVSHYGRFETESEAVHWAMNNRSGLGLDRCACWRVETINAE